MRTIVSGLGGLALTVLAACGPGVPAPPQVGALSVSVVGLPPGAPARMQLVAPVGAPLDLTGSVVIDDLEAGAYELVAEEVCRLNVVACPDVDTFLPEAERIAVEVAAGQTSEVEVVYRCSLLEPPDPVLAAVLLEAVRVQTDDPSATLRCEFVANVTELEWTNPEDDPIRDLEGLQHARRLERLVIVPQAVTDLTPLSGLSELRELLLGYTDSDARGLSADLAPILSLTQLEDLRIPAGPFAEIPDLSGLPSLRRLVIDGALLTDLSPLVDAPLLELFEARGCYAAGAPGGGIVDLAPLASLSRLRTLDLWCQQVADLTPLSGLVEIEHLEIGANPISRLEPLAGLEALTHLGFQATSVASLEVIRGLPVLERLVAAITFVSDVRPLHLHQIEHGSLQSVILLNTCVEPEQVPSAWYLGDLEARGVDVAASKRLTCEPRTVLPPSALATFELDDEGWTTSGDAGNLRWVASGGPSGGGYVEADDLQGGVTWYWEAPPKFDGDASAFLGGQLDVTLKQSAIDSQFGSVNDVILAGAGVVLTYDVSEPVGTTWTGLSVPLSTLGGSGWLTGGNPADEATLAAVLADLTRIAIRGEYRRGGDTGGIGRFALDAGQ